MKNLFKKVLLVLPVLFLASCSNDDDGNVLPFVGETMTYDLNSVADPSISGTAKFIENENGSTTIELQLNGTPNGGMHPAHIHVGDATQSGAIALTLGTVDGTTGFSSVTTSTLNDDSPITFAELLDFDGYINVHLDSTPAGLATLVAQGDIGENELLNSTSYVLNTVDAPGINGTISFSERVNGEVLAIIELDGTPDDGAHPAHIHAGSVADAPGGIILTFDSVDGTTGISKANYTELNDGTPLTYASVIAIDGYVNVHLDSTDEGLATLVAQGNIGSN